MSCTGVLAKTRFTDERAATFWTEAMATRPFMEGAW